MPMQFFLKENSIPLLVCTFMVMISVVQATYFRVDLRTRMLKNGRRIEIIKSISQEEKEFFQGASKFFDKDFDTASGLPLIEDGKYDVKSSATIEMALTHFPSPIKPLPRQPLLLEIYNGYCTHCSLSIFQKKKRIREAKISFILRKLDVAVLDLVNIEETRIFSKKFFFPDRPGPLKIDLSSIDYFKNFTQERLSVVLVKIEVTSYYESSTNFENSKNNHVRRKEELDSRIYISEVRYADKDYSSKNSAEHFWE